MLESDVVVITGANGGLGQHIVRLFAGTSARLALVARRSEPLEALASATGLGPDRLLWHAADLAQPSQAQATIERVLAEWGHVDCLLNTVGTWRGQAKVADLDDDHWHGLLTTNLHTAFNISRAVLPSMAERQYGRIVHVGARAAERPGARQAAYNVSKAALVALTRSIALDYGKDGIRANVVLAGTIDSKQRRQRLPDADTSTWVSPESIARVMLLLCGPAGADINGAAIPVYGP